MWHVRKNDDGISEHKREGENYLEDIGVVPRIILKQFWKKLDGIM